MNCSLPQAHADVFRKVSFSSTVCIHHILGQSLVEKLGFDQSQSSSLTIFSGMSKGTSGS